MVNLWVGWKEDELEDRRSRPQFARWSRHAWVLGVLAGLVIFVQGRAATFKPDPFYRNYWGGLLYGPLAIGLGVLILILAPLYELRTRKRASGRKPRARAASGAWKAKPEARRRDAIDDFDRSWQGGP